MDFEITNHGSIVLFRPLTEAAQEFAAEAFADAQTFGAAYAVEPRFVADITYDLVAEQGFSVSVDGNEVHLVSVEEVTE